MSNLILIRAFEPSASRRKVTFDLYKTGGELPDDTQEGNQPQIFTSGSSAYTSTGISILAAIGYGTYTADLTQDVLVAGRIIKTRFFGTGGYEQRGDTVRVVRYNPNESPHAIHSTTVASISGLPTNQFRIQAGTTSPSMKWQPENSNALKDCAAIFRKVLGGINGGPALSVRWVTDYTYTSGTPGTNLVTLDSAPDFALVADGTVEVDFIPGVIMQGGTLQGELTPAALLAIGDAVAADDVMTAFMRDSIKGGELAILCQVSSASGGTIVAKPTVAPQPPLNTTVTGFYIGYKIWPTTGDHKGSARVVTAYAASTRTFTVSPAWSPDILADTYFALVKPS